MSSEKSRYDGGPPAPIFNMAPRMHHSHQHLEHLSEEDDNDAVTTVDAAKGVGNEEKVTEPMNKISTNNDEDNDVNVEGEVDALAKGLEKQNINLPMPPVESVKAKQSSSPTTRTSSLSHNQQQQNNHKLDPPARERPPDNKWPERDSLSFTRSLVFYGSGYATDEHETACKYIMEARAMRDKYHGSKNTIVDYDGLKQILNDNENGNTSENNNGEQLGFEFNKDGLVEVGIMTTLEDDDHAKISTISTTSKMKKNVLTVPNIDEFIKDYKRLEVICTHGAMRSFCFQRLQLLESAFKMHVTANGIVENEAQSNLLGTDFYRTMKIDNHIHLAAAASAKQFVNFVQEKLENESDTVVTENGQTLHELFDAAGLSADHMTIDAFNVLADYSVYQRFDNFNSKYSPFRLAEVRKIFLKVNNAMEGRYFAELTKHVLSRLEQSKGHTSAAEMRLSIYGMERNEYLALAKWVLSDWGGTRRPLISTHNRWIIQVPRLWRIYCNKGTGRSFQDMMKNLFCPLFEATLYPKEHPEIAEFLTHIVAFDSVDDEGTLEAACNCKRPLDWTDDSNPAYCWQLYYLWANLEVLNCVRKAKGLNTFAFRPHAGETGDTMHLAATYMLATSINHGINLEHQVSLQYLYYLDQVGLSVSPLSNNFLFKKLRDNVFPKLFKRGLNVTLSTDDPLLFHMSDDALLEEYACSRATFDLSMTDISEIARNSILQSGFEDNFKKKWLGETYKRGITFCDEQKTHVPLIRAKFRGEHLALEHMVVNLIGAGKGELVLREMMIHFGHARNAHRSILFNNLPDVSPFPEQNQL